MIHKDVRFLYGHFVDIETNKRLLPKNGSEYVLVGRDFEMIENDILNEPFNESKLLDSEAKEAVIKEIRSKSYIIAKKGQKFVFRIGLGKSVEYPRQYVFVVKLFEDLWAYPVKEDRKDWRLHNCKCEVNACLYGDLEMYEPIYSYSLNDAFSKTIQFYFPLNRKSSGNVQTLMKFFDENNYIHQLDDIKLYPDIKTAFEKLKRLER